MIPLLDAIDSTSDVEIPSNPLDMIIGQERAVSLVAAAIPQKRHVLLCGVPGIGKSMLAKAAQTLLPPPKSEIRIYRNPEVPERPIVREVTIPKKEIRRQHQKGMDVRYIRPEGLPIEVAMKMGYRCPHCGELTLPSQSHCMECGYPKRAEIGTVSSYLGLMRELDVVSEPAATSITHVNEDGSRVTFRRTADDTIMIVCDDNSCQDDSGETSDDGRVLVSHTSSRFVHVSGFSPVELLGDVKHDPYGGAEGLGSDPYLRVIPGAIHEAHEGILYVDEIAALGVYQKHLLTAMQERKYPISAHNPQSSGAAVRVDDVPCDFILIAACNVEDVPKIIPPLRSRIRGYGYEIMLNSWMPRTDENVSKIARYVAQVVEEDGRIPHFSRNAVVKVVEVAEKLAFEMDGIRGALSLRLRDLGGIIRIAGDIAIQEGASIVEQRMVERAIDISQGLTSDNIRRGHYGEFNPDMNGSYFF